jgi:HEAT repeat protein
MDDAENPTRPAPPGKRRVTRLLLLGAALVFLAFIVIAVFIRTKGPIHDGRSVSEWIDELAGDDSEKAQDALAAIGAPAIPYLLDAVQIETSETASALLEKMSEVPLLGRLAEQVAEERARREAVPDAAAEVLVGLRRHADRFVPALVGIYQDSKRSEAVIERTAGILIELGPDSRSAMPSYLAHLRGANPAHKELTVSILSAIGPPARAAVPLLTNLFGGEGDFDLHLAVAEALWSIDRRTNEAVTVCLRVLRAQHPPYNEASARQAHALELLGRIGPAAVQALPLLRDFFLHGRPSVRFATERALRGIDPATLQALYAEANRIARDRIDQILVSLGTRDLWTPSSARLNFFRALPAIESLGPEARAAIPRLVELLTTAPPRRTNAVAQIDPIQLPPTPPPPVGPNWAPREINPINVISLASHAAHALGQIGDGSETVIAALSGQLQSSNVVVAQACCEALGTLGPRARVALPALLPLLNAPASSLRLAAAMALFNISPDTAPNVVLALGELETAVDLRIRRAARLVRWRIERTGPNPMEDLLAASTTDFYVDKIRMLGWFGPEASAALPELIGIVTTNNLGPLRIRAAEAIRRIDPATFRKFHLPGPLALPENPAE